MRNRAKRSGDAPPRLRADVVTCKPRGVDTLPVVLAAAESRQTAGRKILTALVKEIEDQDWMREAGHAAALSGEIFHPPGVVGPIGSAVAAGHIL